MSCGVGCRRSSGPVLLWLWHRPVATAPIRPLASEPPYAKEAALEKAKRQKKKNSGVPVTAKWLTNRTRDHEVAGLIESLAKWVRDPRVVSFSVFSAFY